MSGSAYDDFLAESAASSVPEVPQNAQSSNAALIVPQMTFKAPPKKRKRAASSTPKKLKGQDKLVKCVACDANNDAEYVHPELNVPICGRCNKSHRDAQYDVDLETGNQWECRLCGIGDGNIMFMCDKCPKSFCERCTFNVIGRVEANKVRKYGKNRLWLCFCCDPTLPAFEKLTVSPEFTFFNIESVYTSVRPPPGTVESLTPVPQALVNSLSEGERALCRLFCAQAGYPQISLLRIADAFLTAVDITVLRSVSHKLHQLFRYVVTTPGLFRTDYGIENACQLHPHQWRSLHWMTQAENASNKFGDLRGGVLADAPGLGKTVTLLGLILSTAGCLPKEPDVFWNSVRLNQVWTDASSESNHQHVEKVVFKTLKQAVFRYIPMSLEDNVIKQAFKDGLFPTIRSFEAYCVRALNTVTRHTPVGRARAQHIFRMNMNAAKGGIDKGNRHFLNSPWGARMLHERALHPSAATLIIVPLSLLEHWIEQLKRHVNLFWLEKGRDPSEDHEDEDEEPGGAPSVKEKKAGSLVGETVSPTTAFVRDIAAERRWVMSGTPTTGTSSSIALDQIQRLLTFLRHPEYGLNEGKARWERLIAKPFLAQSADAKELLEYTLKEIMVRHTKADLKLFDPVRKTVVLEPAEWNSRLQSLDFNGGQLGRIEEENGDKEEDNLIDKTKAAYIYEMMMAAKQEWNKSRRRESESMQQLQLQQKSFYSFSSSSSSSTSSFATGLTGLTNQTKIRRPKSIIFSTEPAHLGGVAHYLYLWMGDRSICEHGGAHAQSATAQRYMSESRGSELSRFRSSKRKYRHCPICGGENTFLSHGDFCTKTLVLVEYYEPDQIPVVNMRDPSTEEKSNGRHGKSAPSAGGHGAFGRGGNFSGRCYCSAEGCNSPQTCQGLPNVFASRPPKKEDGIANESRSSMYYDPQVEHIAREGYTMTPGVEEVEEEEEQTVKNTHARQRVNNLALVAEEHIRGWSVGRRFFVGEEVYIRPSDPHKEKWQDKDTNLKQMNSEGTSSSSSSSSSSSPATTAATAAEATSDTQGLLWSEGRLGGLARVRAWKRCGRGGSSVSGWHRGKQIMASSPWRIEDEDASILLLQEDGSTGLDLSFATSIFLLDNIRDPALENQIISRAHRMGAKGPVEVTLLLANEIEKFEKLEDMKVASASEKSSK